MRVDLNADLGERASFTKEDLAVVESVSSVSIACGFHAGSPEVMRDTARACLDRGVMVGAHVSYRDRDGFGRRSVDVDPETLFADVVEQYETLAREISDLGIRIAYVKAHGALYNDMARRRDHAAAVMRAMAEVGSPVLVAQRLGAVRELAEGAGIRVAPEGFPDRAYLADGRLAPRNRPGSVIADPDVAARRAVYLATAGRVDTLEGGTVDVSVETLCIHGDSPGAGDRAARVRRALEAVGVTVAPFVV
jgi:UPF0271 protein